MVYMIGNAHLDPVWLWTKLEGYGEIIATMESAVNRIKEHKEFMFTCSSAAYYEFVKEIRPDLFDEIKRLVAQKRWFIVGGWYVQPDNNFPCGEIFARHALYSQRFYRREFGIACEVGYCVDSFGHNGNLPQILKRSGMNSYVFMRPAKNENGSLPPLFYWQSPDGSAVTAFRITDQNYNGFCTGVEADVQNSMRNEKEYRHDMMCFYGVGNHGGGPTRKNLAEIDALIARGLPVEYSTPERYFKDVARKKLPLVTHESNLQPHAIGCYSVAGRVKALQRRAERELAKAERLMLMAHELLGAPYEAQELESAYKTVLFNTFHDILCGCCIKEGMDLAESYYHEAISRAYRLKEKAIIRLAKNIDTMVDGVTGKGKADWQLWEEDNLGLPLVLFNVHSFPVTEAVAVSRRFSTVLNDRGEALPLQYVEDKCINGAETEATLFEALLAPMSYTTYWIYKDEKLPVGPLCASCAAAADELTLFNDKIKVEFSRADGGIRQITCLNTNQTFIGAVSLVPFVSLDSSDTWGHEAKSFPLEGEKMQLKDVAVTESGPIRSAVRARYVYNRSELTVTYFLYRGKDYLDCEYKVLYSEENSLLGLTVYHCENSPKVICEMPFGTLVKEANGEETPSQRFGGVFDELSGKGIAILSDSKSSFAASSAAMRLVAVRNARYANHYGQFDKGGVYESTDSGLQHFKVRLAPFLKLDAARLTVLAETFAAVEYLVDTYHKGPLKRGSSMLSLDSPSVYVTAFKKAEDAGGVILRLNEISHKAQRAVLSCGGKSFELSFAPNEVKTVLLKENGIFEVDFTEALV